MNTYRFHDAAEGGFDFSGYDLLVCGVENNPARVARAVYCLERKLTLIIIAVSRDGNLMYHAVWEPRKACFGCTQHQAVNN